MIDIPGIENVRIYTYKELRSATEDFSSANKIGEGGFGSVFKVSWHALDLILLLPLFFIFLFFFLGGVGGCVGVEGGWGGGLGGHALD